MDVREYYKKGRMNLRKNDKGESLELEFERHFRNKNAPILILDEITSSLDRKTEEEVLHNIKNLKNRTCLIVTHRNSISAICDREFVVENKKIREKEKEDGGSKSTA